MLDVNPEVRSAFMGVFDAWVAEVAVEGNGSPLICCDVCTSIDFGSDVFNIQQKCFYG
ncbi:hypothetical protein [Nostoc sp.]|uniref:hypothetical protein n=1 Tax=Nostoc sp. TaxID=1180 RepID=UPI002FF5DFA1